MYGHSGPFSYSPRGFFQEDLPQQRQGFQQDDFKSSLLQRNGMARPSGKSIYTQRKEYSETLSTQPDNFQYRVEHLLSIELDGQEVRGLDDCVAKLKRLDAKSRLWPQEMILEVQGRYLQLSDIETKAELESLPLDSILQTKAVLDSCVYNSLLTITVQERSKRIPQVFLFQCEEVGADHIRHDLDKAVQHKGADGEPPREQSDIRSNLEHIIGQHIPGSFWQSGSHPVQREWTPPPPPPDQPAPRWNIRNSDNMVLPRVHTHKDGSMFRRGFDGLRNGLEDPPPHDYTEIDRDTDILNHIFSDIETFLDKVFLAADASKPNEAKRKKKKKKKESKKNATSLPPLEEYVSCLQKFKYGFNLLGKLNGQLANPSAQEFVPILFFCLDSIVCQYPTDLPPTVLSPMLTQPALLLLSEVVSPEEDKLWRSLGDSWNIPRSKWPDGDMIPPYIPEFYGGWHLPLIPSPSPYRNSPVSWSNSPRLSPGPQNGRMTDIQSYPNRDMQPEEPVRYNPSGSLSPTRHREAPQSMRVIYDFMARNHQELSVMKGEVVQVLNQSRQWWLVRNVRNEEGHVPQNVLEPLNGAEHMVDHQEIRAQPPLDMRSTSADVKAWLEFKGFSKITVRSLGVLNGKLLLGMTRDDMKMVCPEEGAKVFFQLQAIKSAIALASEPGYGHY
ncbi:epidermal growth factor receptor kinase substrate 8-like protein 3b [Lampris incognitus]|uniref:epidermal growth factor receptor kinase substrate 8-like protein 3b n=1 Tax=Lampris incognitus TaxID=2546036 RepID=UPI0024B5366D|nr:epidermal growth factor receptor kinase substrate 8-like protein 3b [Lampris incognitus]